MRVNAMFSSRRVSKAFTVSKGVFLLYDYIEKYTFGGTVPQNLRLGLW